jgi:hypothetical protein
MSLVWGFLGHSSWLYNNISLLHSVQHFWSSCFKKMWNVPLYACRIEVIVKLSFSLWHFRSSHWQVWRWLSCGMLGHVVVDWHFREAYCFHHQYVLLKHQLESTRLLSATSQKTAILIFFNYLFNILQDHDEHTLVLLIYMCVCMCKHTHTHTHKHTHADTHMRVRPRMHTDREVRKRARWELDISFVS